LGEDERFVARAHMGGYAQCSRWSDPKAIPGEVYVKKMWITIADWAIMPIEGAAREMVYYGARRNRSSAHGFI